MSKEDDLKAIRVLDYFSAAVVGAGMLLGGAGLAQKTFISEEDKQIAATCEAQGEFCYGENRLTMEDVMGRQDAGRKMALGGLFVILAGGMIQSPRAYINIVNKNNDDEEPLAPSKPPVKTPKA